MTARHKIAAGLEAAARWVRGESLAQVSQPTAGRRQVPMHINELCDPASKITPDELTAYFGPWVPMTAVGCLTPPWTEAHTVAETRAELRRLAASYVEHAVEACTDYVIAEPNAPARPYTTLSTETSLRLSPTAKLFTATQWQRYLRLDFEPRGLGVP